MDIISDKKIDWPQPQRFDSEEEFVDWCNEDSDAEYIDGRVIVPTPASIEHDRDGSWLTSILSFFVEKFDLGIIFGAGHLQVRLRPGLRRNPDIVFVAKSRLHLLRETYIDGAPDLIVEFVSPESTVRDWHDKFRDYENSGVREYWIIDLQSKRFEIYFLGEDGRYHRLEESDEKVFSKVLSGFWIKPGWFWQRPLPRVHEVAKEIGIIS